MFKLQEPLAWGNVGSESESMSSHFECRGLLIPVSGSDSLLRTMLGSVFVSTQHY